MSRFTLRPLALPAAVAAFAMLGGCSTVTVFSSNFNASTPGSAPNPTQTVGTVQSSGDVTVIHGIGGSNENWVMLRRNPGQETALPTMNAFISPASTSNGSYSLLCAMNVGTMDGPATVSFMTGPGGAPANQEIFHIDLQKDGTLRVDDDPKTVFGHFPHDANFDLAVTMDATASPPVAHISVLGSDTSGTLDYPLKTPAQFATFFGAVQYWIGFNWHGMFHVTDILVTKRTS